MTDFSDNPFGAQKNPMLLIGLPNRPYPLPFVLTGSQAMNFANAKLVELKEGDKLYRVFGGPAKMKGAYWSPTPPAAGTTEGAWRSESAVEPWWNDGTKVAQLEVNKGRMVYSYTGTIESQPALYANDTVIPEYWLVGGGTQFLVRYWDDDFDTDVTLTEIGDTPWDSQAPTPPAEEEPTGAALNLDDPQEAHIADMIELGTALRGTGDSAMKAAGNNVITTANAMVAGLGGADAGLILHATKANTALTRLIDIDLSQEGGSDLVRALEKVVKGAAILVGRS